MRWGKEIRFLVEEIYRMKNKKVVISGGAGFIGSNLAHELARDNTVVVIDDLSLGKIENIADLIDKENFTFIKGRCPS